MHSFAAFVPQPQHRGASNSSALRESFRESQARRIEQPTITLAANFQPTRRVNKVTSAREAHGLSCAASTVTERQKVRLWFALRAAVLRLAVSQL